MQKFYIPQTDTSIKMAGGTSTSTDPANMKSELHLVLCLMFYCVSELCKIQQPHNKQEDKLGSLPSQ